MKESKLRKALYYIAIFLLVSCANKQDFSVIEGVWYTPFNRETYPFDTVSIEDDFREDAFSAYTLATDTGLIKYIYVVDTLQSVTRMDVIEIMEFRFEEEKKGILLQYAHFPDVGHIQGDRDIALKSNFTVNNTTNEFYLSEFEYNDTIKVKVLSDDQIQIDDQVWKRF